MLAFLQGLHSVRVRGFWTQDLEQAVAIDSTMSMAYYLRAFAASWHGEGEEVQRENIRKAQQHADRLSPLGRGLIDAYELLLDHDPDRAEAILLDLVSRYPSSPWAWLFLADIHYQHNATRGRPWWECRREYETVERIDPGNSLPLLFLSFVNIAEGDDDYIRELTADRSRGGVSTIYAFTIGSQAMRDSMLTAADGKLCGSGYAGFNVYLLIYPDNHHNILQFVEAHICPDDSEVRERPADRAWLALTLAHVNAGIGRWDTGRAWFEKVPAVFRPWGLVYNALALSLPFIPATEGELRRMIDELERWKPLGDPVMIDPEQLGILENRFNPHMRVHEHLRQYCLAALHARRGDESSARQAIDRLKALQTVDEVKGFIADLVQMAEARIAFEAGDWAVALSRLEGVREARYVSAGHYSSFFQRADARYLRAECLMELGRPEEALRWYDSADQNIEFLLIYTGMAHLRQAEANEQLGRSAAAVEHYRIFLDLFDAPDEFYADDVARARERLAALESAR
jgi:hypothetical protein